MYSIVTHLPLSVIVLYSEHNSSHFTHVSLLYPPSLPPSLRPSFPPSLPPTQVHVVLSECVTSDSQDVEMSCDSGDEVELKDDDNYSDTDEEDEWNLPQSV